MTQKAMLLMLIPMLLTYGFTYMVFYGSKLWTFFVRVLELKSKYLRCGHIHPKSEHESQLRWKRQKTNCQSTERLPALLKMAQICSQCITVIKFVVFKTVVTITSIWWRQRWRQWQRRRRITFKISWLLVFFFQCMMLIAVLRIFWGVFETKTKGTK